MWLTAGLLFLASATVSQAAMEGQEGQAGGKPLQGQQLCPVTGAGPCQATLDGPPGKSPGKTTCQASIDCPPAKAPVKPQKRPKSD
jgi:hypothetical protein